jgi:hypothetical protein
VVRRPPAVLGRGAALAAALLAYCLAARLLPGVPAGVDATVGTLLVFAVVLAVAPVADDLPLAWVVLGVAVLAAATLDLAHAHLAATTPEAIACAAAGGLFARGMEAPALVLIFPLIVAVIDGVSVASGGAPLTNGVGTSDALSLDVPAWGGGTVMEIGVADPVFAAVFLWWAHRFDLRPRATALAMLVAAGTGVALVVAAEVTIPVLPLLAAAFYLANADRLPALARSARG